MKFILLLLLCTACSDVAHFKTDDVNQTVVKYNGWDCKLAQRVYVCGKDSNKETVKLTVEGLLNERNR